jgi:hypothetical protein
MEAIRSKVSMPTAIKSGKFMVSRKKWKVGFLSVASSYILSTQIRL